MKSRTLVIAVIGAHLGVLAFFVLTGGCADKSKAVKLTTAAPVQEVRAPEGEPEAILEPKGMSEEKELLVSHEPEMIPAKAETPPAEAAQIAAPEAGEAAAPATKEAAPAAAAPVPAPVIPVPAKREAAAIAAPAPALRPSGMTHRVAPGESLWKVSRAYGVSRAELARLNNLSPDARIKAGQVLSIPAGARAAAVKPAPEAAAGTAPAQVRAPETSPATKAAGPGKHVVRKGESLSSIAKQYRVSLKKLIEANGVRDPRKLRAGQVLTIPQ